MQSVRLFIRVVDLGSFSKAADELDMGQPAATKMVAAVQKKLGSRLLHQSTHGVTPTEVWLLYSEKCKVIAHHVEEAESIAALAQSQMQGGLRISTSVAFGRRVLIAGAAGDAVHAAEPEAADRAELRRPLCRFGGAGHRRGDSHGRLADSTLGARYLALNPWVIVVSPDYLAWRGTPLAPDGFGAHDALIYSTVQGDARWLLTGPDGHLDPITVRGPLRSNNLSALLSAARSGLCVAALPRIVAHETLKSGAAVPLLEGWGCPRK